MTGTLSKMLAIFLGILALLLSNGKPQADMLPEQLTVGIKVSAPFVISDQQEYSGKSIDIWNGMYSGKTKYVEFPTVDALLLAVNEGKVDVGVGSISINADRERQVDFLHSYFQTGLSYATTEDQSIVSMLINVLPKLALGVLVIVVVIVPTGWVWATIERRGWPTFDNILDGSYWSSATLTTVGYGDENTKTRWGKVYSILLMWSGMFITSLLTGYVLILVTVEAGTNEFNILKSDIAVVNGSSGLHYIESMVKSRNIHTYDTLDAAVESVADGKNDAVIHDKALLDYSTEKFPTLYVSGDLFSKDDYAFAVSEGWKHSEALNRSMLESR